MRSVYIVNGNQQYADIFTNNDWGVTGDSTRCDLVLFTGGEDVSPYLYGQYKHPRTYNNPTRDAIEERIFRNYLLSGTPMVGICRGGQFLNVMNGGQMWQHVDGHTVSHMAWDTDGNKVIEVTSTHHQMMIPNRNVPHNVLMFARESGNKHYMGLDNGGRIYAHNIEEGETDVESVYYPNTNSLCYQPHPEFPRAVGPCRDVFFRLINEYLFGER